MPINSRRKGRRGESRACMVLTEWTGRKFANTPASGGLNWKKANVSGDVVCTKEGHYFPFCVEVKNTKKIDFSHLLVPGILNIDIIDWWHQCARDAKKVKKVPLLMIRYNGLPKDFFFVIVTQEFAKLIHSELPEGFKSIRYHDYNTDLALMVFNSRQFFYMNYSDIKFILKGMKKPI